MYRGTSLTRNRLPLGTYRRVLRGFASLWARYPCREGEEEILREADRQRRRGRRGGGAGAGVSKSNLHPDTRPPCMHPHRSCSAPVAPPSEGGTTRDRAGEQGREGEREKALEQARNRLESHTHPRQQAQRRQSNLMRRIIYLHAQPATESINNRAHHRL